MKELQERSEYLQHENDRLRAHVEERSDLEERDAQDSDQAKHLVFRDKGKKPIILGDVDIDSYHSRCSGIKKIYNLNSSYCSITVQGSHSWMGFLLTNDLQ